MKIRARRFLAVSLGAFAIAFPAVKAVKALALGPDVVVEDATALSGFIPSFLLDHAGFRLDRADVLTATGLRSNLPAFPALPMFKSQFFRKKFLGVMIPERFLKSESDFQTASAMIREIRMKDGLTLIPYRYQGKVFGIRDDVAVSYVRSTTVGINISLGGQETVNLGDEFVLGAALHIGGPRTTLGDVRGLNLGEGLQGILSGAGLILDGDSTEQLLSRSIELFPYVQEAMLRNAAPPIELPASSGNRGKARYRDDLEVVPVKIPTLQSEVPRAAMTDELREALEALQGQNLVRETQWRAEIEEQVGRTVVTAEAADQAFIQAVCDHLAQVYALPKPIWPACRIAATLTPNAYAYPGGDIFITAGLLGVLSDLDSAMLVLGHEIGHVAGRHLTHRMPYVNTVNYAATAVSFAASIFALGAGWGEVGSVTLLNWFPKTMAVSQVSSAGTELFVKGGLAALMAYSRKQEWQSDRFGQQVAYAGGSSLSAMAVGWDEFTGFFDKYFDIPSDLGSRIMSSHPDGTERAKGIRRREAALERGLREYNGANRLEDSWYREYRKIHEAYAPMVNTYGKQYGTKFLRELADKHRTSRLMLETFAQPGGRCVISALGGDQGE